ncbi:hypothetical protein [Neorhizobium sp. NCHU2750]
MNPALVGRRPAGVGIAPAAGWGAAWAIAQAAASWLSATMA